MSADKSMNNIITKIEIDSFRSIQKIVVDTNNVNVFSGLNDVGKSNILKALNLFFNGRTDFDSLYDHNIDYSKVSLASAQRAGKQKQLAKIRIYLKAPSSYESLRNESDVWFQRSFDRYGVMSEEFSTANAKKKASITRLINNIQYFYIPALKGEAVLRYILGEVGKGRLIEDEDIKKLNTQINISIKDLGTILGDSSIQTETKFELPVLVEDFWQRLSINTKYDAFEELDAGVSASKKGHKDPLKEEYFQIPLQLRGDGVKSKFIPPLLQWIQRREPRKYYVWGIDEPENSLEFKKAQEVADLYFSNYSKEAQLFLTSHSLAFIFPKQPESSISVFRCIKDNFGGTKISLLENLFTKQERYALAEEVGALEIQKEIYEDWRVKDREIDNLKSKISTITKPVIFLEGKFDETYLQKTLEVFDIDKKYPAEIKWVGYKDNSGKDIFTGKDNLGKVESFLRAQQPRYKTVLFYDVDCSTKSKNNLGNLIIYRPDKIPGAKYESGIEHLLNVPDDFDKSEYSITDKSGDVKKVRPDKKKILEHVMSLQKDDQKKWLSTLSKTLDEIKTKYL